MATQGYQIAPAPREGLVVERIFDGTRRIQLVTDRTVEELRSFRHHGLFDDITPIPVDAPAGPVVKLRSYQCAIYDETMFVDADCLLLKRDIDCYWAGLSAGYEATLPGQWKTEGEWYGMEIADMLALTGITRLVQMNSGAFFFKRGPVARKLFDTALDLLARYGNFTGHVHGGTGPSDEPYLALAMGALDLDPHPMRDEHCNTWMTATMNSLEVHVDSTSGKPALVKRHRTLSPSLCHFTNLFPNEAYYRVSNELLAACDAS